MFPKKYFKKILLDLWIIKYRTLIIIATIALSVTIYTGTHTALRSIGKTCSTLYESLHLSDLQVNFLPATEDELQNIAWPCPPASLEKRLILPGVIEQGENELTASLLVFLDEKKEPMVNQLKIMEGRYFTNEENSLLLDYQFAKEKGYRPGDEITIGLQGFFSKFKISGLVINPEFLVTSSNPDFYLPVKNSLSIVYLPMQMIKQLFGYKIYNNLSFTFSKKEYSKKFVQFIDTIFTKREIELKSIFFQNDLYSVKVINRDMKSLFLALPSIVGVFILVSFLILLLSFSRMIQQDTKQIGILFTYGFSPWHIFITYISAGALVGLVGYCFGVAFSNFLAAFIIKNYMEGAGLPLIFRYYNLSSFFVSFLFSLGMTLVAAGAPLIQIMKNSPSQLLGRSPKKITCSPKKPRMNKALLSELSEKLSKKIYPLVKRADLAKIGFRNISRRKIFFVLSIAGIVLGISVAEALLLTDTSIHRTVEYFFKSEKWDVFVPFNGLIKKEKAEGLKHIKGISKIQYYKKSFAVLEFNSLKIPYQVTGISHKNSLITPDIVQGRFFSSDTEKGIILNNELKKRLGINIGDQIEIKTGKKKGKAKLTLVGVMNNFIIGQAFVPVKTAEAITGEEGKYTGAFLSLINRPVEDICKDLQKIDFIGYIVQKDETRRTFMKSIKKFSNFISIYSFFSILLAIGIIFVNLYLNIINRQGEYAILLANGFGKREIGSIIFYEILVIVICTIFASIPLTLLISKYFCYKIAKAAILINLHIKMSDFFKTFIPLIFLISIVALYCINFANNINITSTIRDRVNE